MGWVGGSHLWCKCAFVINNSKWDTQECFILAQLCFHGRKWGGESKLPDISEVTYMTTASRDLYRAVSHQSDGEFTPTSDHILLQPIIYFSQLQNVKQRTIRTPRKRPRFSLYCLYKLHTEELFRLILPFKNIPPQKYFAASTELNPLYFPVALMKELCAMFSWQTHH